MISKKTKFLFIFTGGLVFSTPSFACIFPESNGPLDKSKAMIVFEGEAVKLHPTIELKRRGIVNIETNELKMVVKDTVTELDVTFRVSKFVKGRPDKKMVRATLHDLNLDLFISLSEFKRIFGNSTTVGLTSKNPPYTILSKACAGHYLIPQEPT